MATTSRLDGSPREGETEEGQTLEQRQMVSDSLVGMLEDRVKLLGEVVGSRSGALRQPAKSSHYRTLPKLEDAEARRAGLLEPSPHLSSSKSSFSASSGGVGARLAAGREAGGDSAASSMLVRLRRAGAGGSSTSVSSSSPGSRKWQSSAAGKKGARKGVKMVLGASSSSPLGSGGSSADLSPMDASGSGSSKPGRLRRAASTRGRAAMNGRSPARMKELTAELDHVVEMAVTRGVESLVYRTGEAEPLDTLAATMLSYSTCQAHVAHPPPKLAAWMVSPSSQQLFRTVFWWTHCSHFQPDGQTEALRLQKQLGADYIVFFQQHRRREEFMRLYPFLLTNGVLQAFFHLCPASRHLLNDAFKADLYSAIVLLLCGMPYSDMSIFLLRKKLFPDEIVPHPRNLAARRRKPARKLPSLVTTATSMPEDAVGGGHHASASLTVPEEEEEEEEGDDGAGGAGELAAEEVEEEIVVERERADDMRKRSLSAVESLLLHGSAVSGLACACVGVLASVCSRPCASVCCCSRGSRLLQSAPELLPGRRVEDIMEGVEDMARRRVRRRRAKLMAPRRKRGTARFRKATAIRQQRVAFNDFALSPLVKGFLQLGDVTSDTGRGQHSHITPVARCRVGGSATFRPTAKRSEQSKTLRDEMLRTRYSARQVQRHFGAKLKAEAKALKEEEQTVLKGGTALVGRYCSDLVAKAKRSAHAHSKRRRPVFMERE
eukprot:PLAT4987.1.p1 GENE.PLAT4987.1~~PLAT4987.1.p1  ORF type:complete len:719 (+),score=254.99 PLAT4987.1:494-2650(+)